MTEDARTMDEEKPSGDALSLSGWNRQGRWRLLLLVGVLVLLPVVAFMVGRRSATAEERIAQANPPPPSLITAPVERRTLEIGDVFNGRVVQDRVELSLRLPTDQVVTTVEVSVGDRLTEGLVPMTLDDRPVFVLRGDLPLIRPLSGGDQGSIVEQLQVSMRRLGIYGGDASGVFDEETQEAVAELYRRAGFTPPGRRRAAVEGQAASPPTVEITVPTAEIIFLPEMPVEVVELNVTRGSVVSNGSVVLSVTSGMPYVVVEEEVPGGGFSNLVDAGTLTLESVAGEEIGSVDFDRVETSADETGAQVALALFSPSDDLTSWVGEPVDLIAGREVLEGVLAVPVSAVHSDADGSAYVVVSDNGATRQVEVVLGADAGGYVALDDPADLTEGVLVVVGTQE